MSPRLPFAVCLLVAVALGSCSEVGTTARETGYYRTAGSRILDPAGRPAARRGIGLGGWLMPEGYMLHMPEPYVSPTRIRRQVEATIGAAAAERFWQAYVEHYVAEPDVTAIAGWGFDHIRLPFHYDVLYDPELGAFREEGFALVDRFLGWCKANELPVVLDMHAAPGGQNADNISDSDGTARLWTEPEIHQPLTIAIWEEIARRYVDEPWILGYDLINEPVLPEGVTIEALDDFYRRLVAAVRAIDPHHIVFIEGDWYATRFEGLTASMDDNLVFAFHKYWNGTGIETIRHLLELRSATGVPLWLGESGENSNVWFHEVTRGVEAEGIGWNWWTHKKLETVTSPLSAPFPDGYEALMAAWRGEGEMPADPERILMELAANLRFEATEHRPDVVAALLDPDFGTRPKPYREHRLPGAVDAVAYDLGTDGVAYGDSESKNESGRPGLANRGRRLRNDGVDIQVSEDPEGPPFNVGWIEPGEWLHYTVRIAAEGVYHLAFRVAAEREGGRLAASLDGRPLGEVAVPATGGRQRWRWVELSGVELPAGEHGLRLDFPSGGFELGRIEARSGR